MNFCCSVAGIIGKPKKKIVTPAFQVDQTRGQFSEIRNNRGLAYKHSIETNGEKGTVRLQGRLVDRIAFLK